MPREKAIKLQSMSLTPPFPITTVSMNMYEFAGEVYNMIKQAFKILEKPEEGALSYEHANTGNVYRMQKIGPEWFAFWDVEADTIVKLSTQDALAKLFEHAPYIDMVGTELRMDLLKDMAKKKKE